MADINDLKRQRAEAIEAGRVVIDTAEKANRDLTNEEQAKWDKLHEAQSSLKSRIDRAGAQADADAALASAVVSPNGTVSIRQHLVRTLAWVQTALPQILSVLYKWEQTQKVAS